MKEQMIIMRDSDEAAHKEMREVWVDRYGRIFGADKGAESAARWAGCTHELCPDCGKVIPRGHCDSCRDKKELEKWMAAERASYDGIAMLYSDAHEKYFNDEGEAEEYAEDEGLTLDDLRLYICTPQYGRSIDSDYFCDELAEDCDVPDCILEAMEVLNKAIREAGPLSWRPGKVVPVFTKKGVL